MSKDYGDMYQYILESKKAVRNIILFLTTKKSFMML